MTITFKGKPTKASLEFVRAWTHATVCVLGFHKKPLTAPIVVEFTEKLDADYGDWNSKKRRVRIRKSLGREDLATTIVHELVHACVGGFGPNTDEKCTSTLTAKIKPLIKPLATSLVKNTYKVAAYIAHTKLSYRTDGGAYSDHYDSAEDKPIGVKDSRFRTAERGA
jgi:hypothetical protein